MGAIEADGGEDAPEDVMGGLKVALHELSWQPDACKVCIKGLACYVALLQMETFLLKGNGPVMVY